MASANSHSYNAFLSYSTADAEHARRLQAALHRFAKPLLWRRRLHVFRDATHLGAEADLSEAIQKALRESEFLIVLASPDARRSPWVDREIRYWFESHDDQDVAARNTILVCAAGRIAVDSSTGEIDWTEETPLPASLRARLSPQLFIELHDVETANWRLNHATFADRVAMISSRLLRIPKPDLIGTDLRQHRFVRRLIMIACSLGVVLTMAVAWFAVANAISRADAAVSRADAERQREHAVSSVLALRNTRELGDMFANILVQGAILDSPSPASLASNRNGSVLRLDNLIAELERESRHRNHSNLSILRLLDKALNARIAIGGLDAATSSDLFEKQKEVSVREARVMLTENASHLSEIHEREFQRELDLNRKRLEQFEHCSPTDSPEVALEKALLYLDGGQAMEHLRLLNMFTPEGREEAVRVLNVILPLLQTADGGGLLTTEQQELMWEVRNRAYQLQTHP